MLALNFSEELAANTMFALHDYLLYSGSLLSLLSGPDKNKHGEQSTIIKLLD